MSKFHKTLAVLLGTGTLAVCTAPAHAIGLPGVDFYLGAGIGQSNADSSATDLSNVAVPDFDKKDFAWKIQAGARFVSVVGAELEYIDFGKPSGDDAKVKYHGIAGYGLFYLPLPLPIIDVYAKAGLARVDAKGEALNTSFNTDDTKFSFGAGVQLKLSSFSIRGEFQQFKLEGAKPTLLSVSLQKHFL